MPRFGIAWDIRKGNVVSGGKDAITPNLWTLTFLLPLSPQPAQQYSATLITMPFFQPRTGREVLESVCVATLRVLRSHPPLSLSLSLSAEKNYQLTRYHFQILFGKT